MKILFSEVPKDWQEHLKPYVKDGSLEVPDWEFAKLLAEAKLRLPHMPEAEHRFWVAHAALSHVDKQPVEAKLEAPPSGGPFDSLAAQFVTSHTGKTQQLLTKVLAESTTSKEHLEALATEHMVTNNELLSQLLNRGTATNASLEKLAASNARKEDRLGELISNSVATNDRLSSALTTLTEIKERLDQPPRTATLVKWLGIALLVLLATILGAIIVRGDQPGSQITVIMFENSSAGIVKTFAAPFRIQCGTNVTCTYTTDSNGNPVLYMTASSTAATAFSSLTTGTNTQATMTCGTGCAIGVTGTGTNTATGLTGSPSITVTNLTATGTPTFSGIEPASTQCLQISSSGVLSATGSACGSGGGMTWPSAAGFAIYSGSSSWSNSIPQGTMTSGDYCGYTTAAGISCTSVPVTSVALSPVSFFTVSGSPITSTGTFTESYATGLTSNENQVLNVSATGAAELSALTVAMLPTGVPNANLANSSLTVTAGSGLGGGGSVSLGGSVTLTNAGVTSVGLSLPAFFTVSNSPVTTTGSLTGAYATGLTSNENQVLNVSASGVAELSALTTAMLPSGIPISDVGTSGLSGTSPISISSAGAISCSTCNTSSATVSSVGLSLPSFFSVSGSPVTGSGTLTGTYATGLTSNENQVLNVSATGAAELSALTAAMIPAALSSTTSVNGTSVPASTTLMTTSTSLALGQTPLTTAGDTLYVNSSPALARLAIGSTGNAYCVASGLPAWCTSLSSVTSVNGTSIPSSATFSATATASNTVTQYDVLVGGASNAIASVGPGTSGYPLVSGGSSANPSYSQLALSALAAQATNTVAGNATSGSASPTALAMPSCSGSSNALIWTTNTGFGCNTISVSGLSFPVTVSGTTTSGGIPYFSSTTALSSSALLAQYAVVVGGGAGAAPATISAGGAGTLLAGAASANPSFTATPTLGVAGTTAGSLAIAGAASTTPGLLVLDNTGSSPYALTLSPIQLTASYTIEFPPASPTSGNTAISCTAANPTICSWSAAGTGTVTDGSGTTTANEVVLSTSTAHALTYDTLLTDNGTTLAYTGTGGDSATQFATTSTGPPTLTGAPGSCGTSASSSGLLCFSSTGNRPVYGYNAGTNYNLLLTTDTIPISEGGTNATTAAAGEVPNSTSATAASWTATPTLGIAGTTAGTLAFTNTTSGSVTLGTVTGALGTVTASLPANTGTIAELNLAQTWTADQIRSSNNNYITSTVTVTATSYTTTTIAFPSLPASAVGQGRCVVVWETSSTSGTPTFALGNSSAPTDLYSISSSLSTATAVDYVTITSTTTTAVTAALTGSATSTGYPLYIDINTVNATTGADTITLYVKSSSTSYTMTIEPGSYCGWF